MFDLSAVDEQGRPIKVLGENGYPMLARYDVEWNCQECGSTQVAEKVAPTKYNPPSFCSQLCKSAKNFRLVREMAEHFGVDMPFANEKMHQGMAQHVAHAVYVSDMIQTNYGSVSLIAEECEQCTEYFERVFITGNERSDLCSSRCRGSKRKGLPVGVVCDNPHKLEFDTELEAAQQIAEHPEEEGEDGPMVPYLCKCGKWHFGHESKATILFAMQDVRDKLRNENVAAYEAKMGKGRSRARQNQKEQRAIALEAMKHAA